MKNAVAVLGALLCLAASPAAAQKAKAPAPLASAGSVTVSPEEFAVYVKREVAGGLPAAKPEAKRELLLRLTVRKALAAEARKKGLDQDPLVAKGLNEWKYKNYPPYYWANAVDARVEVTDQELWDLIQPRDEYNLAAISFGEGEEARATSRQALEELSGGAAFADLARKYSIGFLAEKGGEMGWQEIPNRMITEADAAVIRKTKAGEVTGPIETLVGTVIYQVREVRTAAENFERFKEGARNTLRQEKAQRARTERAAELRARAVISYPARSTHGGRGPLAVVNNQVILPDALGGADEHVAMSKDIVTQEKKLEELIDLLLVIQDTEHLGLDKQPELRLGLELERTLILANLALRRNADETPPTEAELRAEYERSYVPEVYLLQMIATDSRARAEEALEKVRAGADFSVVAKQYNTGRQASTEGRLNPGPIVNYPPAMRAAIEGIPDDGVSGVLELPDGQFCVVKRIGKQTVAVPPFEQVSQSILRRLVVRRRADRLETVVGDFTRNLKITINEELLATL